MVLSKISEDGNSERTTDVGFIDVFTMFLDLGTLQLHCCLWKGQRALGFHLKHLNLCSEDERRSYGFGTT